MKTRLPWLGGACSTLLGLSAIFTCSAAVITFDDLIRNTGTASNISNGYQGLGWNNFAAFNAILSTNIVGVTGGYYGMVSPSNDAFDGLGQPAEIDSQGTNFDFTSAYFTGAWHSNLTIEVQGFRAGSLLYDQTVTASATNPTLFVFDYLNIDRLYLNSYGGGVAFGHDGGPGFVMDNMTFDFVPEPSSFLLTTAGVLGLWTVACRKRRQ